MTEETYQSFIQTMCPLELQLKNVFKITNQLALTDTHHSVGKISTHDCQLGILNIITQYVNITTRIRDFLLESKVARVRI
jgi:hypothetical protein